MEPGTALGFSPLGHPLQFMREALTAQGIGTCASLLEAKTGQGVMLAGLVIRPHRPPTVAGVVFFSLEDETALVPVTVLPPVYQTCGAAVYGSGMVTVRGRAERRGEGVSLLAESVTAC